MKLRHSGFLWLASKHQAFILWVAKVIFHRRQLMIWHQNWSITAKKAKKKITFDAKWSIVPCKISLLRLMKWTFDVSMRNKKCVKNPMWFVQILVQPRSAYSISRQVFSSFFALKKFIFSVLSVSGKICVNLWTIAAPAHANLKTLFGSMPGRI